jgi:1-aminocyclopropane-1-carboxylate deaminase/D-cysteine desulfhydrase-like pyridoxal-dependent ACC family enzyme
MVGLQPHLILRTSRANDILQAQQDDNIETKKTTAQDDSPLAESVDQMGHTGNILFDRMVGATIYTCTPHEYMRVGSTQLLKRLCLRLTTNTRDHDETKPYPIPVGGSNGLGTFGYLSAVDEMLTQWRSIESQPSLDHVVVACGSGGTAGGIAIGMWLAYDQAVKDDQHQQRQSRPIVHAVGVCDSPGK